jgi:hypothetical protein
MALRAAKTGPMQASRAASSLLRAGHDWAREWAWPARQSMKPRLLVDDALEIPEQTEI